MSAATMNEIGAIGERIGNALERMIAIQMTAYPVCWTDAEKRDEAERYLFGVNPLPAPSPPAGERRCEAHAARERQAVGTTGDLETASMGIASRGGASSAQVSGEGR